MDDVGVHLLGHHRQPALLPGQPRGAVRQCGRAGDDARVRGQPPVAFLVGALADDGQVRAGHIESTDQPVDVPAERPPVGWHVGRIEKYARCHDRHLLPSWVTRARR